MNKKLYVINKKCLNECEINFNFNNSYINKKRKEQRENILIFILGNMHVKEDF